jgi:hypothetical protein
LTILEVADSAVEESKPQTSPHGISEYTPGEVIRSQSSPRYLLYQLSVAQMEEKFMSAEPEITRPILGCGVHEPACGGTPYGNETIFFEVSKSANR